MNTNYLSITTALIARLTAGKSDRVTDLQNLLNALPDQQHRELARLIISYGVSTDLSAFCPPVGVDPPLNLISADEILKTDWPEPIWAIPGLLPVGLTILAGAAKLGKSWLALQLAQAIAAGGMIFDVRLERGPVLYLALEDTPQRLKSRMLTQNWPVGLDAEFMTIGNFFDQIGDLRNGGCDRLTRQIQRRGYRLVVIDTLSRSIQGDQQDVREMTEWLTPLQELAHRQNCVVIIIDHHKKPTGFDKDVIADILGSTAKGAMADTVLGLYRERGKSGSKLTITGRDVEEKNLDLVWDASTGCWQLGLSAELTVNQNNLIDALDTLGPIGVSELARAVKRERGSIYHQLAALEKKGIVKKVGTRWESV